MPADYNALIIRSLAELNEALIRLSALSWKIGLAIDAAIAEWAQEHGWACGAKYHSDERGGTWLAPPAWMVPNDPDENGYLYFELEPNGAEPEDDWNVVSYTATGSQRNGFWLGSNTVNRSPLKKLFRGLQNTAGMPLECTQFFLPILLDQEALAVAIENGAIEDAFGPLRATLDRLPPLATQLEPLREKVVQSTGSA